MPSQFEVTAGKLTGPTTGGTVTQATNKSTGVTLNTESGQITMNNAQLNAGVIVPPDAVADPPSPSPAST